MPEEENRELLEKILVDVRNNPGTKFSAIADRLGVPEMMRDEAGTTDAFNARLRERRRLDRALQTLRKQGKVVHRGGWHLAS